VLKTEILKKYEKIKNHIKVKNHIKDWKALEKL